MTVLAPGATIGILGGGQLARMLVLAAASFGLRCHVFAPPGDNPAMDVASARTLAAYDDSAALAAFAAAVDVVTYEFENVPDATVQALEATATPVRPGAPSLRITQDRALEKGFLDGLGIPVAAWRRIDDAAALRVAMMEPVFRTAILKTRRFGYDGKGQLALDPRSDPGSAWAALGRVPAVIEARIPFTSEVSVVAARGPDGSFAAYEIADNRHEDGILRRSEVPAALRDACAVQAVVASRRIAEALDHVGVLAVEFFVTAEGLIVNEIAPRVHNTGHWTIEGAVTSQFAQHVRAIAGWPLGDTAMRGRRVTMDNLIGHAVDAWPALLAEPGAAVHLYGKAEVRPGRKMGHVTRVEP